MHVPKEQDQSLMIQSIQVKIPIQEEGPQLRRTTREHQPSTRYPSSEYILIADEGEPESFQEI